MMLSLVVGECALVLASLALAINVSMSMFGFCTLHAGHRDRLRQSDNADSRRPQLRMQYSVPGVSNIKGMETTDIPS